MNFPAKLMLANNGSANIGERGVQRVSRLIRLFCLVLVLILSLTLTTAAREIVVNLWDSMTGPEQEGLKALIARFNEKHKGEIRVERLVMPVGEFYDKLALAVAGNAAPELAIIGPTHIMTQAVTSAIRPIDEYFEEFGWKEEDWLPGLADLGMFRGVRYGVPSTMGGLLLYYNADHIVEAALPGPPTNSDEYLAYAKKLTLRKNGEVTRYGTRLIIWGDLYRSALYQKGGDYFTGADYDEVIIDNEVGHETLQYFYSLVYEHQVAAPPNRPLNMFAGETSLNIDGIWWLGPARDHRQKGSVNLQVGRADRLYGDARAGIAHGAGIFVLPAQPDEDAERDRAIMTFVDYFGKHSMEFVPYGVLPTRVDAVQSSEFSRLPEDFHIIISQSLLFPPPVPWAYTGGVADSIMRQVLIEGKAISAVLKDGAARLAAYIAETKEDLGLE